MTNLPPSSTPLPARRLEWRPSRQQQAALLALALLAAFALLHCDLPRAFAWPGAAVVLVLGALRIRHAARQPVSTLVLTHTLADCRINGQPVMALELRWRGALLFVRWKHPGQRRWQHTVFWPDTLTTSQRRALRLIAPGVAAHAKKRK